LAIVLPKLTISEAKLENSAPSCFTAACPFLEVNNFSSFAALVTLFSKALLVLGISAQGFFSSAII